MYLHVTYKGKEYKENEAKTIEEKLVKKSKKIPKPCCFLKKEVGKIQWQSHPRVGRGYTLYQCPLCKRVSFKLNWIS